MQVFVKYGLFKPLEIQVALSDFQFVLLVIATICIAAAGNVINDIYDVNIDAISRPEKLLIGRSISEKAANRIFMILNILGVVTGFYLANSLEKPSFAAIFIIISALLYMYASYLKGILLLGNVLISFLVAFSIMIVGVFDIVPVIALENRADQLVAMKILLHYAFFAFFINFIREIVKDVQDINGDKNGGLNTLPIAIGIKRTAHIIFGLSIVAVLTVIIYMYVYLYNTQGIMLYFLLLIVAPLLYFCVKTWNAEIKKDFALLSVLLKIIMFLGMCSILLYKSVVL
jgi:4-hydroxybenzoate polyprenyltransferase